MKKILFINTLILLIIFSSCKKDDINNTDDRVGSSRVTKFATFQMTGNAYMSIVVGQTYTEPGVKAFEGTREIPVTKTGTVNGNQVGLYVINYSATNSDGFSSSTNRYIAVLPSAEFPNVDLSGKYDYVGSSTYTANMVKVAPGMYTVENVWSGATVIPAIIISSNGTDVLVPNQTTGYGPLFGTGTYNSTTRRLVYSLNLPQYAISNSTRTWQRQ
jgi:hypothetical protein